jgi:hypothetical protein
MAGADTPQPLTLFEAIIPIATLIVLVALSYRAVAETRDGVARPAGERRLETDRRSRRGGTPRGRGDIGPVVFTETEGGSG